jgi:hypothetical protein
MIKNIVVNLSVGEAADAATAYAVSVAAAFEAHLAGIAFSYEPSMAEFGYEGVAVSLIEAERSKAERAADAAIAKFEASARREGLSAASRRIDASFAIAGEQFATIARRFDLAIVTQAEPRKVVPEEMIIEAALFDSGRPVLAVPYIQKAGLTLDRVMVCWDGSRNAARAAGDALPFLARAKTVEVVMVTAERVKSDEMPGPATASTCRCSASSRSRPTWPTPSCPTRPMRAPTSSSWAATAIRACASSCSAARPAASSAP